MKQETLEEVAKIICHTHKTPLEQANEIVKLLEERSYSEKDMKSFADWCRNGLLNTEYSVDRLNEHLEQWKQFKKQHNDRNKMLLWRI